MKNHFRGVAIALALTSLSSLTAQAENEEDRRATFAIAREAMQAKQWDEASRLFMGLWKTQRTYDVALHLGQVEYQLQRFREAASHLDYGLMLLPPREKLEIIQRSRALLDLCKEEIGTLELRVKNKGATVLVDGITVAEAPLITDTYVNPGKHRFEVRLAEHLSEQWEVEFAKGERRPKIVQLKPVVANSPPPATLLSLSPAAPSNALDAAPRKASWTPVIVGGALSLVGLGTGIGFALVRRDLTDDAKALRAQVGDNGCSDPRDENATLCSKLHDKNSDYDTYGTFEAVGFTLSGVALAATATYFFVVRPDKMKSNGVNVVPPLRFDTNLGKGSAQVQLSADF